MTDIVVNHETCTSCGACVALCSGHVFEQTDGRVDVVKPQECWLCGHCVAACPVDAIDHRDYPLDCCPRLDPASLPLLDSLVAAFRERRSARIFRDRPVPREVVQSLVDIGRWAPTASNKQPVDWLAFDDPARIAELSVQTVAVLSEMILPLRDPLRRKDMELRLGTERIKGLLDNADSVERMAQRQTQGQDPIFWRAPVVLVAHVPEGDYFGRDDAIYATYNLMLASQRTGLGTCQIGYFLFALDNSAPLCHAAGLPEGRRAQVALILGYPKYRFRRALSRRQPNLMWNPGAN